MRGIYKQMWRKDKGKIKRCEIEKHFRFPKQYVLGNMKTLRN